LNWNPDGTTTVLYIVVKIQTPVPGIRSTFISQEERNDWENLDIDGNIMLKCVLDK
jgi:hypothetical protein